MKSCCFHIVVFMLGACKAPSTPHEQRITMDREQYTADATQDRPLGVPERGHGTENVDASKDFDASILACRLDSDCGSGSRCVTFDNNRKKCLPMGDFGRSPPVDWLEPLRMPPSQR
jgi:hypothetical protein